jgi:uncharacterized phiE125 gp8 family phage protein
MTGVYNLVSSSSTPIVSLAEAKLQTNTTDFGDDDALLTSLLDVATQHFDLENGIIGRPLLTQVWEYTAPPPPQGNGRSDPRLRGLPPATGFVIDRAPLQSVDKVEYLQDGAYQTLASGQWVKRKISKELTFVRLAKGVAWPRVDDDEAAWKITMSLGYGATAADVPAPIRHAALLMISHLYQNREAVTGFGAALQETPLAVAALVAPFRAPNF